MAIYDRLSASDYQLFEKRVVTPYLQDILLNSTFSKFTGNSPTSLIWNMSQKKGEGERIVIPLDQIYFPTVVFDETQLEGTGDRLVFANDGVVLGEHRFAIAMSSIRMAEIQVRKDIDSTARRELSIKGQLIHTCKVMNQFGLAFVGDTVRTDFHRFYHYKDFATQLIPKMLACYIDDATQASAISSDRVVFGKDRVAGATVAASVADAVLTSATDDALTVEHIYTLSELANRGSRDISKGESPIIPYQVAPHWGFQETKFVLFTGSKGFGKLRTDPDWKSQTVRGEIEREGQPSILYQSIYKGTVYSVMVIVIPEFDNYTFNNEDGHTIAYSALCGQSAIFHAMGGQPMVTVEDNDHKKKHEIGMTAIDAMKVLKYASKADKNLKQNNPLKLERGMIHSFTRVT